MAVALPVKPGISANAVRNIPQQWDPAWFRRFITDHLQNADYRNAIAGPGISITIPNGNTQPGEISSSGAVLPITYTYTGSPDAAPGIQISKISNYTGGTVGFVTPALEVITQVTQGSNDFEWAGLFIMNNNAQASTSAQNVALYGQGNKTFGATNAETWAAVFELRETTGTANPTTGSVALELDMSANGTDNNVARVGCDMVIRKFNPAGAPNVTTFGYRIQNGGDGVSSVDFGFVFETGMIANVGFDTSQATMVIGAYQMASGQPIIFDGPSTRANTLKYNGTTVVFGTSAGVSITAPSTGPGVTSLAITGGAGALSPCLSLTPAGTNAPLTFVNGGTSAIAYNLGTQYYSTGTATPTHTNTKPGANASTIGWMSVTLNGTQGWVEVIGN